MVLVDFMANRKKSGTPHWAEAAAEEVLGEFPDQKVCTTAAGISPSGVIHFGNFRDVMTAFAVGRALQHLGKKTRTLFTWDDYDRFRKVPEGIDQKFEKELGKPLSAVPDPHGGKKGSYAERFEKLFEASVKEIGIELEYRYQTKEYAAGKYDKHLVTALKNREKIAEILFSLMSDKAKAANDLELDSYRKDFYPVSVYSRFTGTDHTRVVNYDGDKTLTYECKDTNQTDQVVIGKDRLVKLSWKTDWAMRWMHEKVGFEPAGADHASPGGSRDASSRISRDIFNYPPPVFIGYGLVGLQGEAGKMSGSAGTGVSPSELLDVYEVPLLRWQYLRRPPKQNFSLAFDTEIYRQYDEFDREMLAYQNNQLDRARDFALRESFPDGKVPDQRLRPAPFRQIVSLGQIVQWDVKKLTKLLSSLGPEYDADSIKERVPKARNWLENHNPDEMVALLDKPNTAYARKVKAGTKKLIKELVKELKNKRAHSVKEIEDLVYALPKDPKLDDMANRKRQRAFFGDVYHLLIGQDTGPRLSTFLWAADRPKVIKLLSAV
ncbi:lysine--tRNA ligase [Patescibacteria group bacterium]|nr:lysine--tRNA ligase [Patescibacteria group bacterium]